MNQNDKSTQAPAAPASFPLAVKTDVKAGNLTLVRPGLSAASLGVQSIRVLPGRIVAAPA